MENVPSVPVEAFRVSRVATHPKSLDTVTFLTSGTTSGTRGGHSLRRTDTYRLAAVTWGEKALRPQTQRDACVICLAPPPSVPQESSLGFMMQAFIEEFDGPDVAHADSRFLLRDGVLDLEGLQRAMGEALDAERPILLLTTSFALVHLLDTGAELGALRNPLTVIMQTGGFKGKSRVVEADWLRKETAKLFGIDEARVVSEYGMTELCSQLYEGTLPGGVLEGQPDWLLPPPWLQIEAVDPESLEPVEAGREGLARFTDFANVDSALRVLTLDRIVCRGRAVRLLGRSEGAPPRGCSLAIEELLEH
ncbi:MAG: acyl-protein synthetase [Polyangiaceae bacterium]